MRRDRNKTATNLKHAITFSVHVKYEMIRYLLHVCRLYFSELFLKIRNIAIYLTKIEKEGS